MDANYKQSIAKSNSNPLLWRYAMLAAMGRAADKPSAREIVAANVDRLMKASDTLNTQAKLGKAAGLRQRTIGYLLNPEATDMKSPKLDTVEKVARAFGLEPWVLLADPKKFGEELSAFLQRPIVRSGRLRELGSRPLTEAPPPVRGKRGQNEIS